MQVQYIWRHAFGATLAQRSWYRPLLPATLFIGALVVRGWVLGWGLPFTENVDEPAVLETAARMVRDGDPNPHKFLYPSLYYYLLSAALYLYGWWGVHQGLYNSLKGLPVKHYIVSSAPGMVYVGRAVTALLGAATVPALHALGKRMFNERVGLLGALLLIVAPFHLEHSDYITTDVPSGLWVVFMLLGVWEVATSGRWRGYVLGGVMAGLAGGTKYNAGVVGLTLAVAHVFAWRWQSLRMAHRLIAAGGLALLTFLVTTPYALLDWRTFINDLRFNAVHYSSGNQGDFIGRWQFGGYARFFWNQGLYPSGSIMVVFGLPLVARHFPRQAVLLVLAIAIEMLLLLSYSVNFERNTLPILPLMILLAGAGAVTLADIFTQQVVRATLLIALSLLLLVPFLTGMFWTLDYWSKPHTMADAVATLQRLPRGMRVAAELPQPALADQQISFAVERVTDRTLEWYRANGFRYLLANDERRTANDKAAYARLLAGATVVKQYPARRLGLEPGPGGAILDLGERVDMMRFTRHPVTFGDQVALLGYEIRPGPLRSQITPLEGANVQQMSSGQPIEINLYWRALAKMNRDYTLFIHVINAGGQRVAQRDLPVRFADYPTSRWQPNELVIDTADFELPALPKGTYKLNIGLYDAASGQRMPIRGAAPGTDQASELLTLSLTAP